MEATTVQLTKITVSVTQEDINAGEQGHCEKCPIALAFKRAVPAASDIDVGRIELVFLHPDDTHEEGTSLAMPLRATGFIDDFDKGGASEVEPFNFTLHIPTWATKIAPHIDAPTRGVRDIVGTPF